MHTLVRPQTVETSKPKASLAPKPQVKPKPKPKPKPKLKPKPKPIVKPVVKKIKAPVIQKKQIIEPREEIVIQDVNTSLHVSKNISNRESKSQKSLSHVAQVSHVAQYTGEQKENIKMEYLQTISQSIAKLKKYPRNARKLGQTGVVKVSFKILSDGTITEVAISDKSGFGMLDKAAKKILLRLAKVAPIPKELKEKSMRVVLPVEYRLR